MLKKLFPSPEERTVASALLLLSNTIPHQFNGSSSIKQRSKEDNAEEKLSLMSSNGSKSSSSSSSSSSTLTTYGSMSFMEKKNHKLRLVAVVSCFHNNEMKFKVVRKKRSKVSWSSASDKNQKMVLALPSTASFMSELSPEENVSCISSTSSAASSARSRYLSGIRRNFCQSTQQPKKRSSGSGSSKMSRKADAILKMLSSGGSSSEVKIRQVLGDSPDTSKALRMLLRHAEVKRSGIGGRLDPYIYKIA